VSDWPFTLAELTAGLRRYFAEPGLRVRSVSPGPQPGAGRGGEVRGLLAACEAAGKTFSVACVVKEPRAAGRKALAHPGVREAGVYRALASQLPMATPALIAADPDGRWLVLEAVEAAEAPEDWAPERYAQAVALLASLHERFWALADDLAVFPWLARPLTLDYEIHVYAAAQALDRIVRRAQPALIAESPPGLAVLGQLISQAERVAAPLRAAPFTLLHGDYWEGNLLRDEEGDLIVLDWQLAGIGPGVLDLRVMAANCLWERGRLPVPAEALADQYRREIARVLKVTWTDAEWAALWDCALLWRFLQEILPWAAGVNGRAFAERADRFQAVWLGPVLAAARRRLNL
jgi:aminoglycoside phosphotransferase (APT) family kinase protein